MCACVWVRAYVRALPSHTWSSVDDSISGTPLTTHTLLVCPRPIFLEAPRGPIIMLVMHHSCLRAQNPRKIKKKGQKWVKNRFGGYLKIGQKYQKNPRVHKIFVRDSGAGNGCANSMGASKKCVLSAGKTHVHKIPPSRGGGVFGVLGGGGECRFYFYGREDFCENRSKIQDFV